MKEENEEEEEDRDEDNEKQGDSKDNQETSTSPQMSTSKVKWEEKRDGIIDMLKDKSHDIHLLTGRTKEEKCKKIWRKYASYCNEATAVDSVSSLLLDSFLLELIQ